MTALIEKGYVDDDEIEPLVRGKVKKKISELSDSLFGTMTDHQIFMIRGCWSHMEFLQRSITSLEEKNDQYLKPYEEEVKILLTVPGISKQRPLRSSQKSGPIWINFQLHTIFRHGPVDCRSRISGYTRVER